MFDYDIYNVSESYGDECVKQVEAVTKLIEDTYLNGTQEEKNQMFKDLQVEN